MRNRLSKCSKHVAFAACLLALGGSFSACQDEYTLDNAKPVWLNTSIYETLESNGNYTNYLRLIADPDVNSGQDAESSLVTILSQTGSKTVFAATDQAWQKFFEANKQLPAANPWHGATSYELLSKNQKKLLLHTSMLNNAITMENLSADETKQRGMYLRRSTDVEVIDSITRIAISDLPRHYWSEDYQATEEGKSSPESDQWSRIRTGYSENDSIYMVMDHTDNYMIHFTSEFMTKNQITDEDFRIIMGQERITDDVHVYDAHVDSMDIVCENGYINLTAKPLIPLANMAEIIRTNGKTDIFSHLLERFSVPLPNDEVALRFSNLYPEKFDKNVDTLYTKRYYSKRSAGSTDASDVMLIKDDRGNIFANTGEAILKFDPGWSGYYPITAKQANFDMGAMFVPSDTAMIAYFNNGGGRTLLDEYTKDCAQEYSINDKKTLYRDIDQIPLKIVQAIINQGMFISFVSSVPSKMTRLREATTLEQIFSNEDTKLRQNGGNIDTAMVASNGVVYIMNNVHAPSDFDCVATPAYIRSTNRIMRWAIYSDFDGQNYMGLNYYAYLKAMQSRFSFFLPNDEALKYYYDPMSFTSKYPRVMRFLYTKGNFPFATKTATINSEKVSVLARYDVNAGTIGNDLSTQSTNQAEIINRLRQLLEHNTIVHEGKENTINTDEDEYYLSKNGMGIRVIRQQEKDPKTNQMVSRVYKVQGGFQAENQREGLTQNHPGIIECNVLEKGDYKNGWTFTIDAPLIPASRSVFSVLSNMKRGAKGETTDWGTDSIKNANPYWEFFNLCRSVSSKLITGSGLVDEQDPKYDKTSNTGKAALERAINKFITFNNTKAVDYNVSFWESYRYTLFAPTNEAVREAIANGLPTWESIQEDYDKNANEEGVLNTKADSLRIQAKITYLTNFIRTHFADNTVFADKSAMPETEMFTSSYDSEKGIFVKAIVKREKEGQGTMLKVKDNTSAGKWFNTVYNVDGRDVKNVMTCDRECNTEVKDQTMNNKTVVTSSYAIVHLIEGVLNHTDLDANGKYPTFEEPSAARKYIKKYAIR